MQKYPAFREKFISLSFISVVALIALSLLLILGIYFVTFVITESKMSKSYNLAAKTYYLAEAGVNEAIWKLQNDDTAADGDEAWEDKFVTEPDCNTWQASFERIDILCSGCSYTVTIQNSFCARGEIVSTAKVTLPSGKTTQRIVKTKVFKALNPSPIIDSAVFTSGPSELITIQASVINIFKGNIFSNNNILMRWLSTVNVNDNPETGNLEGKALAVNNINRQSGSVLNATAQCAKNICQGSCEKCPPDAISMPMIDFDSADPSSYKSKAQAAGTVYTSSQFDDLLWANPNLTLDNEVTYVTGPIELRGGQTLTVNGILLADGSLDIGQNFCWVKSIFSVRCGNVKLTINRTVGKPAGFLTKGGIDVGLATQRIDIVGLLYANDKFELISLPQSFNITGGMAARKITITSIWQGLNITYDSIIISEAIGNPIYSPVVTVEHWEETY